MAKIYSQPPINAKPESVPGGILGDVLRLPYNLALLCARFPKLFKYRCDCDRKVLLVPGWRTPEISMLPLKLFLSCLGYQVRYWRLGTNWVQPEVDTYILRDNLLREFEKNRQNFPLDVIGWSLGGVVARELARMEPKLVRSVITLGTPVIGGPTYTVGAPHWGREECLRITKMLEEMDAENPIQTPVTSIFTRRDQAVHWAASIDRFSKSAKHIEVDSTHMKLGIDELVFRLLVLELCDQTNCSDIPEVAMETV